MFLFLILYEVLPQTGLEEEKCAKKGSVFVRGLLQERRFVPTVPKIAHVETTQGKGHSEMFVPKLPKKERTFAKVSSRRKFATVVSRSGIPSRCQMVWLAVKGVGCLQHSESHCP